ncbi:MAG: hypothetical protein EXR83_06165 [Gammaproteobacteria bacterium]|nr:hypothetical protein [Gammaproteobacteria bacterium]
MPHRVLRRDFSSPKNLLLSLAVVIVVVSVYHQLIQRSVRHQPAEARRAVTAHCRYLIGKRIKDSPTAAIAAQLAGCTAFELKKMATQGGLIQPVMVRITIEKTAEFPLDEHEFIFKSIVINFTLSSAVLSLVTGHWKFNEFNTYSDFTFRTHI